MDPSRKDDEAPKPDAKPGDAPTEDRDAILSRRRFLIESALASAGLTLGVAGCGPSKQETVPQVCLSVAPTTQPETGFAQPPPPKPTVCLQPQVCLSPVRPDVCLRVAPQKCLKIAPPDRRRDGGTPQPRVCLSRPRPRPCLSIAPRKKDPSGQICLEGF